MAENKTNGQLKSGLPFRIVGLIATIFVILSAFIGSVTYISNSMTNNTVSIVELQKNNARQEILIASNSKMQHQNARTLVILDQHESSLKILTEFMTKGGRFTASDGDRLSLEIQTVKERMQHYEVLEIELAWIKKSILSIEANIKGNFDSLSRQIDVVATKQDKVYEGHQGSFSHGGYPR